MGMIFTGILLAFGWFIFNAMLSVTGAGLMLALEVKAAKKDEADKKIASLTAQGRYADAAEVHRSYYGGASQKALQAVQKTQDDVSGC